MPSIVGSASILLRLPGEIRNRIFEYTLTSSRPLHHRAPLERFSLDMPTVEQHPTLFEAKHVDNLELTRCPEFNQLKFVNKQLYKETAGLELQFNRILFSPEQVVFNPQVRPEQPHGYTWCMYQQVKSAEQGFIEFVQSMKAPKHSWLTKVIVQFDMWSIDMASSNVPPIPLLPALADFCKRHPTTKIQFLLSHWNLEDRDVFGFFSTGVFLTLVLRSNDEAQQALRDLLPNDSWSSSIEIRAGRWREIWNIKIILHGVDNFAFWPAAVELDRDDEELKAQLNFLTGQGLVRRRLEYRNSWINNGIKAVG